MIRVKTSEFNQVNRVRKRHYRVRRLEYITRRLSLSRNKVLKLRLLTSSNEIERIFYHELYLNYDLEAFITYHVIFNTYLSNKLQWELIGALQKIRNCNIVLEVTPCKTKWMDFDISFKIIGHCSCHMYVFYFFDTSH